MGRFSGEKHLLVTMICLQALLFIVEIIFGYASNSMALVADSFHVLSDGLASLIAYIAIAISATKYNQNTYGWARAGVLGALINTVFLLTSCFSIIVEGCKRFIEIEAIHKPQVIVVVGVLGLILNIFGLFLFRGHNGGHGHSHGGSTRNHEPLIQSTSAGPSSRNVSSAVNMNMRGVYLHLLADAIGSVIVIVSALISLLTNWKYRDYMDPALSLLTVIFILCSAWPLFRESALILLQNVPFNVNVDAIKEDILKINGVLAVHEFHVWQLTHDKIIASAHIRCTNATEYMKIAKDVKMYFHENGIHSTTIQPEFVNVETPVEDCVLDCPDTDMQCQRQTCCGRMKHVSDDTASPADSPNVCRQRNTTSVTIETANCLPTGLVQDSQL